MELEFEYIIFSVLFILLFAILGYFLEYFFENNYHINSLMRYSMINDGMQFGAISN